VADFTVARIGETEGAFGGALKRVRAALGVSSFGLAVLVLPPGGASFDHDHRGDGQEEVYLLLDGAGWMELDGGDVRVDLDRETFVRVGPSTRRNVLAGPDGARVLIAGATPGHVYDPPDLSKLGQLPLTRAEKKA
jgi:quercetin dioxygenase-like cupin family protein